MSGTRYAAAKRRANGKRPVSQDPYTCIRCGTRVANEAERIAHHQINMFGPNKCRKIARQVAEYELRALAAAEERARRDGGDGTT